LAKAAKGLIESNPLTSREANLGAVFTAVVIKSVLSQTLDLTSFIVAEGELGK
jgi:hypothetical protein